MTAATIPVSGGVAIGAGVGGHAAPSDSRWDSDLDLREGQANTPEPNLGCKMRGNSNAASLAGDQ